MVTDRPAYEALVDVLHNDVMIHRRQVDIDITDVILAHPAEVLAALVEAGVLERVPNEWLLNLDDPNGAYRLVTP